VYNERDTLEPCLRRVVAAPLPVGWDRRIILVDDHSDEDHFGAVIDLANRLSEDGHDVLLRRHAVNRGKGAALQTAYDEILRSDAPVDDLVVIQDADLEYDPSDFQALMAPVISGDADAVIGSRWGTHRAVRGFKHRIHAWGNSVLTWLSNVMTGFRIRDMECCYKLMSIGVIRRLRPMLTESRFGIEPQLVAGMSRLGLRVVEVPISYEPRGVDAGKKIGWVDGVRALYVIARERVGRHPERPSPPPAPADQT
jgi:glycosyltransferase involved in cell wall biosynthesis